MKKLLLLFSCMVIAMLVSGCDSAVDKALPIPDYFSSRYEIIESKDISYSNVKRMSYKITLPKKLSKSDIKNNFRYLVRQEYKRTGALNVSIFAYISKDESNGSYTVAMYEFCPYGDWERTDEANVKIDEYAEVFNANSNYFEKTKPLILVEKVEVKKSEPKKVILSTDEKWDRNKRSFVKSSTTVLSESPTDFMNAKVFEVKNGTHATIIDTYSETLNSGGKWVAYKVKTSDNKIGWVLKENAKITEN